MAQRQSPGPTIRRRIRPGSGQNSGACCHRQHQITQFHGKGLTCALLTFHITAQLFRLLSRIAQAFHRGGKLGFGLNINNFDKFDAFLAEKKLVDQDKEKNLCREKATEKSKLMNLLMLKN